jgi:hypothetical protein
MGMNLRRGAKKEYGIALTILITGIFFVFGLSSVWGVPDSHGNRAIQLPEILLEEAAIDFDGGSGTQGDPYLISTIDQLQSINNNSAYYKLTTDIDASATAGWNGGKGFSPLSWFNGSLDGDGHSISGLVINQSNKSNMALFTSTGSSALIKDLDLVNVSITGKTGVAALVVTLAGTVQNVTVSGTINGTGYAGGLVGQSNSGTLSNCSANITVASTGSTVGGLLGYNNGGLVTNCFSLGSVSGVNEVGGLVGKNEGTIESSYSEADVTGTGNSVGGLIGLNNGGTVDDTYATGDVTGVNYVGGLIGGDNSSSDISNSSSSSVVTGENQVGGLIGWKNGGSVTGCSSSGVVYAESSAGGLIGFIGYQTAIISMCFSTADVYGGGSGTGGLVGIAQSATITDTYAMGDVNGEEDVGGLVGEVLWGGSIINSYSSATVNGDEDVGGLVGSSSGENTFTNSYWDVEASGVEESAGGIPMGTDPMNEDSTYVNNDWDFSDTWIILEDVNDGYPFFSSNMTAYGAYLWSGVIDSDWNKAGNWQNGVVPDGNGKAYIPDVVNQPFLTSNITICNLYIFENSLVTIGPSGGLTVTVKLKNDSGSSGFVIDSDEDESGSLNFPGAVSGTLNRRMYGGAERWHMISSPVASQAISPEFTPTVAAGTETKNVFFCWHEPDSSWVYFNHTSAWNAANGGNYFVTGKGYLALYENTGVEKQFTGSMNYGNITANVTKTLAVGTDLAGVNLLGNPYPSSVDWKATGWGRTMLVKNGAGYDVWIWSETNNNYGVYNSASSSNYGTNGVSRYIAPTQGFFVQASANGTVSMSDAIRVHQSDDWIKKATIEQPLVRLAVTSEEGYGKDEIALEFEHNELPSRTLKKFSLVATAPSLYIPHEGKAYSLCMLDTLEKYPVLPVAFKAGAKGYYSMTVEGNPGDFENLILKDKQTGLEHDFKRNAQCTFYGDPKDHPARFVLQLKEGAYGDPFEDLPAHVFWNTQRIVVDLQLVEKGECTLEIFDIHGRKLMQQSLVNAFVHQIPTPSVRGILIVRLTGSQGVFRKKLMVF